LVTKGLQSYKVTELQNYTKDFRFLWNRGYLGVFDGVFWFFHRLCGIFFVTLQDIRAKAEPSLTEKVKKMKQGYRHFQT
jgi:hypothetical protein